MENLKKTQELFKTMMEDFDTEAIEVWNDLPDKDRLACAYIITKMYKEHLDDPGSYRYLIYDRMGFGPEAYAPLQIAGALDISNAFHRVRSSEQAEEEN